MENNIIVAFPLSKLKLIFVPMNSIQSIISISSVVVITLISLFSFWRLKKFDNENHLYKLKIDLYNKIISRLYNLVQFYQKEANRYRDINDEREKEKLAENVDDEGYAFEDFIDENALLLPEHIIEKLEIFINKIIYQEDPEVTTLDGGVKKIYSEINHIINLFRKDLNIESVNRSLHFRTR
jgi:hypothetical protein